MHKLSRVLHKLDEVVLHLNKDKCFFLKSSVEYLGHVMDENGLHPTAEKVKAIKEAPKPRNIEELRRIITVGFYQICQQSEHYYTSFSIRIESGHGQQNKTTSKGCLAS